MIHKFCALTVTLLLTTGCVAHREVQPSLVSVYVRPPVYVLRPPVVVPAPVYIPHPLRVYPQPRYIPIHPRYNYYPPRRY